LPFLFSVLNDLLMCLFVFGNQNRILVILWCALVFRWYEVSNLAFKVIQAIICLSALYVKHQIIFLYILHCFCCVFGCIFAHCFFFLTPALYSDDKRENPKIHRLEGG